jgi:hypothetical protein
MKLDPIKTFVAFFFNLMIIGLMATPLLNAGVDQNILMPIVGAASMLLAVAPLYKLFPEGEQLAKKDIVTTGYLRTLQTKLDPNGSFKEGVTVDSELGKNHANFEVSLEEEEPGIVEDPKKYPLEVETHENQKMSYKAHVMATLPQRIGMEDEVTLPYNKLQTSTTKHARKLNTRMDERALYNWAPDMSGDNVYETTGGASAMTIGGASNGKLLLKKDVTKIMTLMNADNVPFEGRRMVIDAFMYNDVINDSEMQDASKLGYAIIPTGLVGRLWGFDVYMRSSVYAVTASDALRYAGLNIESTDKSGALFFHPEMVRMGMSAVETYLGQKDGTLLGRTVNSALLFGADKTWTDEHGVYMLKQG